MVTGKSQLAATLPPIVPLLERWETRAWPRFWNVTGQVGLSWKDPWRWSFFIAWLGRCVEPWLHFEQRVVAAADGHDASIRMLRGVLADAEPGEVVTLVQLYHVQLPLTREDVVRVETANRLLGRDMDRDLGVMGYEHRQATQSKRAGCGPLGRRVGDESERLPAAGEAERVHRGRGRPVPGGVPGLFECTSGL